MKKKIVALVGALTLTFAMSMNVLAHNSIDAEDVADSANAILQETGVTATVTVTEDASAIVVEASGVTVTLPATVEDLDASFKLATTAAVDSADDEKVTGTVNFAHVWLEENLYLAIALAENLSAESNVAAVQNLASIYMSKVGTDETATVAFTLAGLGTSYDPAKDEIWAVDGTTGDKIVGVVENGKVYFTSSKFSPFAIVKVTKAVSTASQPPYNPLWDPTSPEYAAAHGTAAAPVANVVVIATAPKTGDVVMMVSIMAMIFMAGAAVAVAMSKKRA